MIRYYIFIPLFFGLCSNAAMAEHEVDHRYNVRGYVLDGQERAVADQDVRVFDGSSLLASGKTDASGYYSLQLHLHNEDRGKKISLRAGANEAEIRVSFDPSDITTVRVHEANFVGGQLVEKSLGRFRIPTWLYALAGLVLILLALVVLERRRKKKLKLSQIQSGAHQQGSGHGSKKRKRRKR